MTQEIMKRNHFTLIRQREIAEMQGTLWEMEHTSSGAKLAWLQRADENMTFAIGFRTIPTDSTGVFHILEHSVLAGSEKYPVKEPFVELLKSSLQTFLNAMTYPDKTVYPVSSRNKQDFHNLMDVYMDAVLHPTVVKSPNVFRQEGWRLEFDEDGQPLFQGVVYNEMKGAYSDVATIVEETMMEHLYPDTCYSVSSGGDPAHIPELSYEHFVAEHDKYYHPSNAYIVLDGDVDLQDCLSLLDSVLSPYQKQTMDFPIPMQKPLPYHEARIPYEAGGEDAEKTIISFGKLLCPFSEPVELLAASLLADYLTGDSEAPLKRAVLDAGLGEDMQLELSDGIQQASFGWQVWNTQEEKLPEIKKVIHSTVQSILDAGLDSERLAGCYNSMAFKLMDRDSFGYPRGLLEALNMLDPWLYGGDPAMNLHYRTHLEELQKKLASGYLEEMMRRLLLDESDGFLAVFVPDTTLGQRRAEEEKQRAKAFWESLSPDAQQAMKAQLDTVHLWQQTPDSPEALATIPMLGLSDIQGDPKSLPCTVTEQEGRPVLLHAPNSDLCYLDLHFDASDVVLEDIALLGITMDMLTALATETHTAAQIQNLTRQNLGLLAIAPQFFHIDESHHRTVVTVSGVCLEANRQKAAELMAEILNTVRFDDADTVLKLLRQRKIANQQRLIASGNRYAAIRVGSQQTSAGAAMENLVGCESIRRVDAYARKNAEEIAQELPKMKALCQKIFCRQRLTVSVSKNCADLVGFFLNAFPAGSAAPEQASFQPYPRCREGIRIPASVGYSAKGANIAQFGQRFTGQMYVLSNLLTFEYLWTEVRVKGGAYGTGFRVNADNDLAASSYRDPSPGKSIGIFDSSAQAVRRLCAENGDLTKYILGAMSDADPLRGAYKTVLAAEARYFRGITQEDVVRRQRQMLSCTPDDLVALCPMLEAVASQGGVCIIAGQQQLDACGDQLDCITEIPC